jgi:hypothetical protein
MNIDTDTQWAFWDVRAKDHDTSGTADLQNEPTEVLGARVCLSDLLKRRWPRRLCLAARR